MLLHRLLAVLALTLASGTALAANGWNQTVVLTPQGTHILGNPKAGIVLTEFVSYTCPHCAHFETEADAPLRIAYVASGKVAVEVRHMLRDPIDLTVALLSNCGPKDRFFGNHTAFMRSQSKWIQPVIEASPAQRTRWQSGDKLTRLRYIASDLRLYDVLQGRGYSRPQLDHCLADEAMAQRLAAQGGEAEKLGITATPSFALNGVLLAGTHDWATLEPQIKVRL